MCHRGPHRGQGSQGHGPGTVAVSVVDEQTEDLAHDGGVEPNTGNDGRATT